MIPRYTLPAMQSIWSEENRFRQMLRVEILVCEALARRGEIPPADLKAIQTKAAFDLESIREIEKATNHDVVAFVTDVARRVGPAGRHIHRGLTSSDVLDTALAVQMTQATDLLLGSMEKFRQALKKRALEHRDSVMIGRTHGVHAEPTTFGLKLALFHAEALRNERRLRRAREEIAVGKLSGAVGTFAHLPPDVEEEVCRELGLQPAPIATQVIQRDRHALLMQTLALIGTSMEKVALEIRHLQRTEVREAEEFFDEKGQKGSSAMPHKRNPILSERLCGLARLLRGYAQTALENIPLWHERDISHSSAERVILPDAFTLLHYMLEKGAGLLERLLVYPERMRENLEQTYGLYASQTLLLELNRKGLSREEAYALVQRHAMTAWREGRSLETLMREDPQVTRHLDARELRRCFDLEHHLRHRRLLFERAGLSS
jgi:adenylosuccinate lyase